MCFHEARHLFEMAPMNRELVRQLSGFLTLACALFQLYGFCYLRLLKQHRERQGILREILTERNMALQRYRHLRRRYIRSKRRHWVKPGRTQTWWKNLWSGDMPEDEWKKNLRMPRNDFLVLTEKLRSRLAPDPEAIRADTLSAEKKLAMVLYYLKDQGSYRMTTNAFGIGMATLSSCIRQVCHALVDELGPELIQFPLTEMELRETAGKFEQKFGFPQVIGCVDGTHIPIKQPQGNSQDFFCYKMKYTINVQAICNESGLFTDMEAKWPGSVHDAKAFSGSGVSKLFSERKLPPSSRELIPGYRSVPPLLPGDPAYPLLPNVMKEYPNCTENKHVVFNEFLRSARNQIECAFGRLKARWRILNRPMDIDFDLIPTVIMSCFILHNFCELQGLDINNDLVQRELLHERSSQSCPHHRSVDRVCTYNTLEGSRVRDTVADYFEEFV